MKVCEWCGATFSPTGTNQRFCSEECRKKAGIKVPPKKNCECCGKEFVPKRWDSKYCSRKCQAKGCYSKKTKSGEKVCRVCGKTFYAVHGGEKYCSNGCRAKAANSRAITSYERRKTQNPPKICLHCGKEFIPNTKRQIFCSSKCSGCYRKLPLKEKDFGIKKCKQCGKEFKPNAFNQKYCSEDCRGAFHATKRQEYKYQRNEGIKKPKNKTKKKYDSPATKRWATMKWKKLTEELLYYKLTYPQTQIMAQNNTLPEDFGLKKKKVAR